MHSHLTLGGDICKPVPLQVRHTEVFSPYSPHLSVICLRPQIASPLLVYSFAHLRWSGGPVHRPPQLHMPGGLQGHHNANPYLEEDWDPKTSLAGRWTAEPRRSPVFYGLAILVLCKTWHSKLKRSVLKACGNFFQRYLLECCYICGSSYVSLQQKKCLTVFMGMALHIWQDICEELWIEDSL